jgi:hypothetical protein
LPTGAGQPGIGTPQGPYDVGNSNGGGSTEKWTDSQPVCRTPGTPPTDPALDRRRTSVAVINCSGGNPNGRDEVNPISWMDVFLVEPSFRRPAVGPYPLRTSGDEIYAEVIRSRPLPGIGQTVENIVRRDVPRLIE